MAVYYGVSEGRGCDGVGMMSQLLVLLKNRFSSIGETFNGYKRSPRSVLTNSLFEQYFFLTQYWTVYSIYLLLASNK